MPGEGFGIVCEDIKPLIGTRIIAGKDALLGGAHAARIRELLEGRGVLVFPSIGFSDEEQVAFTATLGSVVRDIGGEDIYRVSLDPQVNPTAEFLKASAFWHFDGYTSPLPVRASLLSPRVLPPSGGDTEFANTYAAYEALPQEDRDLIADLRAVHTMATWQLAVEPEPRVEDWDHWMLPGRKELPLVWKHESGRKSLLLGISAHHIVGMDPVDGKRLLIRLREFATGPQFTYSHRWQPGDLVIWDNTGTLHRVTAFPMDSGRLMHRTKLEGEEEIG